MSWNNNNSKDNSDDDGYRTVNDDEYSDEDDYEPIEIAAWGDNNTKSEPPSWNNLIDSSVKIKAGGIGSGDLHRRGGNFKPLSEATILAQRLNKPIPGKKGPKSSGPSKTSGAAKRKKKKPTSAKPVSHHISRPIIPVKSYQLPERKPPANAPPSTWGSTLVETPFWEVKKEPVSVPVTPLPTQAVPTAPATSSQLNWNPETTTGFTFTTPNTTSIQFVKPTTKTEPAPTTKNNINDNGTAASKWSTWNPEASGFTPINTKPKAPKTNNAYNVTAPIFNPSTSSTLSVSSNISTNSSNSPVKSEFNTLPSTPLPFVQLAEKKPVKISSPSTRPSVSNNVLLRRQLQDIQKSVAPPVVTPPVEVNRIDKPYVTITLEIAEGIFAVINLYHDSNATQVAEEFGKKHNLIVTDETKNKLASTFQKLLDGKREKEQYREQHHLL